MQLWFFHQSSFYTSLLVCIDVHERIFDNSVDDMDCSIVLFLVLNASPVVRQRLLLVLTLLCSHGLIKAKILFTLYTIKFFLLATLCHCTQKRRFCELCAHSTSNFFIRGSHSPFFSFFLYSFFTNKRFQTEPKMICNCLQSQRTLYSFLQLQVLCRAVSQLTY